MLRYIILALLLCITSPVVANNAKTFIPVKAYPILPIIRDENAYLNLGFVDAYIASSMEKESCISLTHSRCFDPNSQLLTYWDKGKTRERERGIGLGQFTRTYHRDGTIRFDTLTRLALTYRTHLKGLSWDTVRSRPDLQIRGKLLLLNETYRKLGSVSDVEARHAMMVSAYNSGDGRLSNDRQTCKLKKNCDPNLWWGNVEDVKAPGFATKALYGHKSAWHLNRNHVVEIFKVRDDKYKRWYSENP